MGSYVEEQEWLRYCKLHKKDCELKTVKTKRVFNIPIISIKQSRYEKVYFLFDLIQIVRIVNFEGF